jgi:hypothetical protein
MQGLMCCNCLWVLPYSHIVGFFFGMAWQPLVGQGLLIVKASQSHSDTPLSIGLLWTSDRLVAETSNWQNTHTPLPGDRRPCPQQNSNPNPSKRAAAEPCLRLCGYWHQLTCYSIHRNLTCDAFCIPFNSTAVVRWLDMYKFHNFIDCTVTIHNSSHVLLCSACSQQ